ncbi:XRE family transcriptional regulator, partial [Streptococcus pneumoniae]|nr:XRE family transcriptional regulator [Streptococcus pneumoniae]
LKVLASLGKILAVVRLEQGKS